MKTTPLLLVVLFFCFSILSVVAQTEEERLKMANVRQSNSLMSLQNQFELKHTADEKKINDYLVKHPDVKRIFVKENSVYYLKGIDSDGNPMYINTKNKASGELIKADQMYSGGSLGVNITGTNMVVGIWDGGQVRATHELLTGKVAMQAGQTLDGSANNYRGNNHQTHVSGTIVGKDIANQPSARGIAHGATALNYDFSNDLAEMTTFASGGYLISNHSYGAANDNTVPVWRFGAYDSEAKDWDILAKNAPNYLPFVAGGNEQTSNGNMTKAGYDLMTGSSAAKNVITVGAVNGDKTMSDYSNWGPTDDGRVKPDIVAKGTGINSSYFADKNTNTPSDNAYSGNDANSSGTSYATPAVSASGLLLQQYHNSLYGSYMKASTLKALLLGTAEDLGQPGPDHKFGWGLVNVEKAANTIKYKSSSGSPASQIVTDATSKGAYMEEITYNPATNGSEMLRIVTANGCEPLVVSIAWTDDEGTEQVSGDGTDPTASRLVYDFDMLVRGYDDNSNVFVSEARPWKPSTMANRTADATLETTWFDGNGNNYRQVKILNPPAGRTYRVYMRKKAGSPATARLVSLVVTGTSFEKPTGLAAQSFCNSGTVANLAATGSSIKWYDASTGGNVVSSPTALTNGTTYYASQTILGCESPRLAVTATINTTAAPTGSANQSVATGSTIANLVATGTNIKWYDAATGGNLLPNNTALTNGTIYYASQTINSCESTTRLAVTVTIAGPCPTTLTLIDPTNNTTTGITNFQASETITASNKITGEAKVTMKAGKSIELKPSINGGGNTFEAANGTVFSAYIQGCAN